MILVIPPHFKQPRTPQERRLRDAKIRRMRRNRYTIVELANLFGISHQRVSQICRRGLTSD